MKKIIFSLSALAALLLAGSCQRENLEPVEQGGTVTYTVQVPQDIATKADGDDVFTLHYEVYRKNAKNELTTLFYEGTTDFNQGTADVHLEFVKDQKFKVLFWAQKKSGAQAYDITDLREVSLNNLFANDRTAEVFAGNDDVDNCESAQGGDVVLVRPVAQLNIATTADSFTLGTTGSTVAKVDPTQSKVVVDGLYDTYNVATGTTGTKASTTYKAADVPGTPFKEGTYKLMATNYLGFIPQEGDNVKVTFTIYTLNDGNIEHTVSNVPVKANYQTNIIGNLISATADYQVTLEDWADAGKDMEVLTDGLVKNINGDYEITNVKGLAYAINNLFVDANGVANTATFYVKPSIYDMAQQAINDITVTSGTLKVYDTEAVVTRSATTSSVIITGLKKALIQKVGEDATVFFSGITVTDFNGADDAAALVQNNEGKVVLAGCDIENEEGQNTELVGGNDPVEVEKGEEEAGDLIYTAEQLAAAFADETVESIALGADIVLENTLTFPAGRAATLDLRGWELTVNEPASNYAINNHGILTIKDSYATGEVNARGIYNGYVAEGDPISSARLIVESGSFNAMGTNGGAAVYNYGVAEINGGNFTSIGGYSLNNQSDATMTIAERVKVNNGVYNNGATLIINGGEIEGNRSGCHVVYSWNSTVTINGGTIHNNNSGNSTLMSAGTSVMTVNAGTFSIKDGRVEGNGNTWTSCLTDTQNTAVLTINGGTFNGGFRVQGGTTMTITDGIFNDVVGSGYNVNEGATVVITGGSYNFDVNKWCHKDYKAVKNAETALWDVEKKVYVVMVTEEEKYESIQDAVDAAEAGATITFLTDITQVDGVLITDKNLTIDLKKCTFTVSEGANTNNRNFKVNGASEVTIKNGTMVADGEITSGAYGTVRTEDSANVILNEVKSYSYRGYGLNVKACTGTKITINDSEIYVQYSGGVEAEGGEIELNNVKIVQNGVDSSGAWCSVAIAVNGGGKVTVNSGEYSAAAISTDSNAAQGTWVAYVMSSGGTLDINGGTFNGTVAETAAAANACGLICADTKAVVNIYEGTFTSNGAILDMRNNTGGSPNPVATLYGGKFSADPTVSGLYSSNLIKIADGFVKAQFGEYWTIYKPIAKVANTEYGSIDEAIAAWTNNTTLTLLDNVTLSDVVTLKSTEYHILDLGTYTMTAAKGKDAISISNEGRTSASYALDIKADATNPGGITATGKAVVKTNGKSGVKDRPIIRFYNGVFTGNNVVYHSGSNGTNCPQFWFYGGVFNGTVNANRALFQFHGGTFNGNLHISVDSSAYALISGGRFINLNNSYHSDLDKDNNIKITIGSAKGVYDRGIYVDDQGYFVVGGSSITDFGEQFQAKVNIKPSSKYDYLYYSSAAEHGLYYTNADVAIAKHGEANVVLK